MLPGTLLLLHPVPSALRLLHYLRGRVVRGRLGVVSFGVHRLIKSANGVCRFIDNVKNVANCVTSHSNTNRAAPTTKILAVIFRLDLVIKIRFLRA